MFLLRKINIECITTTIKFKFKIVSISKMGIFGVSKYIVPRRLKRDRHHTTTQWYFLVWNKECLSFLSLQN